MANTRMFIKDASIKFVIPPAAFGTAIEYNCDAHLVEVLSEPGDDVTYETMCDTITQKGPATYSLHIVGVQDWGTSGLSRFLWTNAGVTARAVVQAHGKATAIAAETPGFDCSVVLVEGQYGGEVSAWAEFDVELPCTVRPILLTTTPTALAADAEAADAEAVAA